MRRYLVFFAIPLAVLLGPAALLSIYSQPISGDLTRIGGYSERDFGWRSTQPVISVKGNGQSIIDPDILVLGDSFSEKNLWQSELSAKLNKKILSFKYSGCGCIANWIRYALSHKTARTAIIETVERSFVPRFRAINPCEDASPIPMRMPESATSALRSTWPPTIYISQTFRVVKSSLKMAYTNRAIRGGAINAPLIGNCALFSNRRADRILYYPEDELKLKWKQEEIESAITNALHLKDLAESRGKKLILLVVPDKLSVYQECLAENPHRNQLKQIDITRSLIAAGVSTPDLLTPFQDAASKVADLYFPNDTHLSPRGNILMADQLAAYLY